MPSVHRLGAASVIIAVAVIVALATVALLRSQTSPQFTTSVNAVTVSVSVLDKEGRALEDLRSQDFEVLENKQRQTIQAFKYISLATRPQFDTKPTRPLRTPEDVDKVAFEDEVRVVVVFLDDYHVRAANSLISREQVAHFIRDQLGSRDLVAVMTPLMPLSWLTFTQDRFASIPLLNEFLGRKFDHDILNDFELRYAQCRPPVIERVRREVTMSALQGLVERMATMGSTRKSIVFLSEGFSEPQMIPKTGFFPHGDPNDPVCQALAAGSEGLPIAMRELSRAAVRANVSIYSFDPRGFGGQEFSIDENMSTAEDSRAIRMTRDILETLSDETDGAVIYRPTDADLGLGRISRESSSYYLLAYNSSLPSDGKFHEITVRVNRKDVTVHARKGYWATLPPTTRPTTSTPAIPRNVTMALASLAQPPAGGYVRTWIGASQGTSGSAHLTFIWEPDINGRGVRPAPAGLQLSLLAGTDTTTYFQGVSRSSSPVNFDAPPGPMHLVTTIRDQSGEVIDRRSEEFIVPDFAEAKQALSTPVFLRARSTEEWDRMMRMAGATPTALREFRRVDRVLVRFATYGGGSETPTARLLDKRGVTVRDLSVSRSTFDVATHQIELPITSLATADYVLEIVGPARDALSQLIGIRIVP